MAFFQQPAMGFSLTSERAFLELIDRRFANTGAGVALGRGDDCALFSAQGDVMVSTDLFLQDQHFRTSYFTPREIGHKALAVNISDIAAMGGRPLGFTLSLMIPREPKLPDEFWDDVFKGMSELSLKNDCPLVGGDLSSANSLGFCVTIFGEKTTEGKILHRGGCRPGDILFVVENTQKEDVLSLGLPRTGLMALELEGRNAVANFPAATAAHLLPRPLIEEGLVLAKTPGIRSLMDLSDGLARDLPRLLGAELPNAEIALGAALEISQHRLHPEVLAHASKTDKDPVQEAVLGGEDYALLGAAAPEKVTALRNALPGATKIGVVENKPGLLVNGRPFAETGFDHFSA